MDPDGRDVTPLFANVHKRPNIELPTIDKVSTGNNAADVVLGGFAGVWNVFAGVFNGGVNLVIDVSDAIDFGISWWDENVGISLTSGGLRMDLDAFAFISGANPQLVAEASLQLSATLDYLKITFVAANNTITSNSFLSVLNACNKNQINHIVEGSKGHFHNWELLSPNKDWNTIKNIINDVYSTGLKRQLPGTTSNLWISEKVINGYTVQVRYMQLENSVKLSDAWVVK